MTRTYELIEHRSKIGTERWIYRLSAPVALCTQMYGEGEEGETEYVAVSWGRAGDTLIIPTDEKGRALDMLGWAPRGYWVPDPEEHLREWLESLE